MSTRQVDSTLGGSQLSRLSDQEQPPHGSTISRTKIPRHESHNQQGSTTDVDVGVSLSTSIQSDNVSQLGTNLDGLSLGSSWAFSEASATIERRSRRLRGAKTSPNDSHPDKQPKFRYKSDWYKPNTVKQEKQFSKTGDKPSGPDPIQHVLSRPQPTADYLIQAGMAPTKSDMARPRLIIMDLNGCLLDRGKNKSGRGHLRPYLKELLQYSLEHHKVMIWSSATPVNVKSMSEHVFTGQQKQPIAIWDRASLRLTETQARSRVQVYKQLNWVWDDEEITRCHPYALSGGSWNQTNTILIDDSMEKAAAQPHNQLIVPEYKKENDGREKQVQVLLKVAEYLKEAACYEDVSSFIFHHPFQEWVKTVSIDSSATVDK